MKCKLFVLAIAFSPLAVLFSQAADPKGGKVVIVDPAKADADFAMQGEYEGTAKDGKKIGAQVIAEGNGAFTLRVLQGGLTGAGWDGKPPVFLSKLKMVDGKLTPETKGADIQIADQKLRISSEGLNAILSRVERKSDTLGLKPPANAIVLFDSPADVSKWNGGKIVELSDGKFLGIGEKSKQKFKNFKAHVEFRLPFMPSDRGQGRANSGVYLQDRYEVQVLDSFGLKGENNECGGIYTQYAPAVNMCFPPLQWQTYDIVFTAATYADGKRIKPAVATILHNGVKIHDNIELKGSTGGGDKETDEPGPFQLQDHGNPVVYRNIWVVETK